MLFCGDFCQLPPVKASSLYGPLTDSEMGSTKSRLGHQIWNSALNTAIILDGKYRFRSDPEFGELLSRFRNGAISLDDIKLLNRRCISGSSNATAITPPPETTYVFHSNAAKDAHNAAQFRAMMNANPKAEYLRICARVCQLIGRNRISLSGKTHERVI